MIDGALFENMDPIFHSLWTLLSSGSPDTLSVIHDDMSNLITVCLLLDIFVVYSDAIVSFN